MDIFTALHTRRSIRTYTDQPVTEEQIRILLDAAMIAPSAGNSRPWEYIVVDDKEILAKVPAINPYAAMAPKAPVSIVICGNTQTEKYKGFWVQDCSAAVENLLLAATGLGLGAVWTGIYPLEDRILRFRELLKLPEHVIALALIAIGYPASPAKHKSRFEEEKVHRNQWGCRG